MARKTRKQLQSERRKADDFIDAEIARTVAKLKEDGVIPDRTLADVESEIDDWL